MNFVKKLIVFCFVGLAFQQASYAMDGRAYKDAKKNLRNAVIKRASGQMIYDMDDMNLVENALDNLRATREEAQENLILEDLVFNDGENVFTLFAKNTILEAGVFIEGSFCSMVDKIIEHLGIDTCLEVIKKQNRDGKTFISIVFERKLLSIFLLLLCHQLDITQAVFSDIILKSPMYPPNCFFKRNCLIKKGAFLSCCLETAVSSLSKSFKINFVVQSYIKKALPGVVLKEDFPGVFEKDFLGCEKFLNISALKKVRPDFGLTRFKVEVSKDIVFKKFILERIIDFSIKNGLFENKNLGNALLKKAENISKDIDLKIKNLDHSSDKKKLAVMLRSRWMDVVNKLKKIVCKTNMPHAIFKAQKNRDYVDCSVITK
ncbi:hypothetical protein ACFLYA_02350 [Candidatus Dependentiae bacterium]